MQKERKIDVYECTTNDYFHYGLICYSLLDQSVYCLECKMYENSENRAQSDVFRCLILS